RDTEKLSGSIVHGNVKGRLGIGIATHISVHLEVQVLEALDILPFQEWRQMFPDNGECRVGHLTRTDVVLAAPVLEELGFAPSIRTVFKDELDQQVTLADRAEISRPGVGTTQRQADEMGLDFG